MAFLLCCDPRDSVQRVRSKTLNLHRVLDNERTLPGAPTYISQVPLPQFQTMPLGRRAHPFSHPDWVFEIKWDGFRSLVQIDRSEKAAAVLPWPDQPIVQFIISTGGIHHAFAPWLELPQRDLNGLCRKSGRRKIWRMEFFQLHHPPDVTVLCDHKGCEQVADYLEVDDHGHEYRVCASHTDSKTHASRLPTRKPNPDLLFRSRPAA